jgi:hypothetical protein
MADDANRAAVLLPVSSYQSRLNQAATQRTVAFDCRGAGLTLVGLSVLFFWLAPALNGLR